MYIDDNKKLIRLQDKRRNGKKRNWRGYKLGAYRLYHSYMRLGMANKGSRVFQCGAYLDFLPLPGGGMKLVRAYLCGDKLCPLCAMQRARKLAGQVNKIVEYMSDEKYRYIFITLTQRNVKGDELKTELDKVFYAFNRFTKTKEFKALSEGWIRALEVTHKWEDDTYHPHLHMIVAVKESYFNDWENYLRHEELKKIWTRLIGQEDEAWVRIQKVRRDKESKNKGAITYSNAVAELTKYSTKSSDYMVGMNNRDYFMSEYGILLESEEQCNEMSDKAVATICGALHNRRMIAYGGKFREVHKLLNLKDPNNDEAETDEGAEERLDESKLARYRFDKKIRDFILDLEFTNPEVVKEVLKRRGP